MKKLIFAMVVAGMSGGAVHAQESAPVHSFSGSLAVVSDYRFRGLSQTFKRPAVQGGVEYAHVSGLYAGSAISNISDAVFPGGDVELDLYGGYRFNLTPDVDVDAGIVRYYYPGTDVDSNATEVYVGGSYKWFSVKYSHAITNFFALNDTEDSNYLELGASFEVAEKTTLGFHAGHQRIHNHGDLDYSDYGIALERDFGFATIGFSIVGTNADRALFTYSNAAGTKSRNISGTGAVLSISKSF